MVHSSKNKPLKILKQRVEAYQFKPRIQEKGVIVSVGDGIAWIKGLPSAALDEILLLEDDSQALVFHLTENLIGTILLEQTEKLVAGMSAFHFTKTLAIPVGDRLLGRVLNPLGEALDNAGNITCEETGQLDKSAPPIVERAFVNQPLNTGNKMIDTMIPIGKGQRELIIGDNGLGKSSLALDIVINQKDKNVLCVYVIIGQRQSSIVSIIDILKKTGALRYTTVVVAEASTLPGLRYLAPFAGCAIAEYWMNKGLDILIIYDDLTEHANSYRELSLLLRRPPGREAFPADIFYLHARLLERATCLSFSKGGGSMTALPIVETKEGEIASYIPTNLISITDGQIYLDENLFSAGFLPAINLGKSISRVGGKAQDRQVKKEASRTKLDYLQFLDLEIFSQFSAKLDPTIERQLKRGKILREILKQERFQPQPIEFQLGWLIAYNELLFSDDLIIAKRQLGQIKKMVTISLLTLSSSREEWVRTLKKWFDFND